jgi:hypothetical protein
MSTKSLALKCKKRLNTESIILNTHTQNDGENVLNISHGGTRGDELEYFLSSIL